MAGTLHSDTPDPTGTYTDHEVVVMITTKIRIRDNSIASDRPETVVGDLRTEITDLTERVSREIASLVMGDVIVIEVAGEVSA